MQISQSNITLFIGREPIAASLVNPFGMYHTNHVHVLHIVHGHVPIVSASVAMIEHLQCMVSTQK